MCPRVWLFEILNPLTTAGPAAGNTADIAGQDSGNARGAHGLCIVSDDRGTARGEGVGGAQHVIPETPCQDKDHATENEGTHTSYSSRFKLTLNIVVVEAAVDDAGGCPGLAAQIPGVFHVASATPFSELRAS